MAQQYDNTAKNLMLDALGAVCLRLALHTCDPGAANAADNEITGGTPAYARKAIAWNAAASGSMDDSTNGVVFDIPASTTVAWVSGWNTAGTVRYFKKQVTSEAFAAQGTYTITDADLDLNNDPA
jgi:hypothetical protein